MIDTHQHNWLLHQRVPYAWITPGTILYRDFPAEEIKPQMDAAGVAACVLVEADNSIAELEWMLEQVNKYDHILGVVGGGELFDPQVPLNLERFAKNPAYKGVRIYWEEPGEDLGALETSLAFLAQHSLSCDIVMKPQAYTEILATLTRHPNVQFILDHFAGVQHVPDGAQAWAYALKPLADLPNTVLKLSGYLTAAHPPTLAIIQPYFEIALEYFGADRLLYGSDYPVCTTLGQIYGDTVALLRDLIAPLSAVEQDAIMQGTAKRVYRLE